MSYFPCDIPFMSKEELEVNEIKIPIDWLPAAQLPITYCRECINRPECPWTRTEEDYCSRAQKRRNNE